MCKLLILLLIIGRAVMGCGLATAKKSIKIGHPGDFSGPYSFYDSPVSNGARFAIDEINAAGGVLGMPLGLVSKDCRNDQGLGVRLTEELIRDGAVYIIGTTGDPILVQGTVSGAAGVPISTGDGTAPNLVGDMGKCAFQICMSDNIQGALAAEYAYNQGYRTAYMVYSTETPYTNNLPTYFQKAFEKLGGKVLGYELYRIESGDYSAQVTKLTNLSTKPDFIFTPMFLPDTPVFIRQLRTAGLTYPVISTDGNHGESLIKAGKAVEGLIFTTHGYPTNGNKADKLWQSYKAKTGNYPVSIAFAVGYDEIYYLKQSIESVGSAEPEKIIEGLSKVSNFDGVLGTYTMDPKTHRVKKPVTIIGVKDGAFVFVDQFYPGYVPDI
ncbi:MAG: ABC transporter substrate-binding protein [Candidatus Cloacimonetes bacterium]|nr:ABC transporter substrate-binding protein [Candidatus Cloacimonadota bacterium]